GEPSLTSKLPFRLTFDRPSHPIDNALACGFIPLLSQLMYCAHISMESPLQKEINVLRLSNFQQFTFRSYLAISSRDREPITNPGQGQVQLREVCLDFTKSGILSCIHGGQLWVFSSDRIPDDEFSLRETSIGTLISSSLLVPPEETTSHIRPQPYVLAFLTAIRNLISYKFTSEWGYTPCGSYLLPPLPLQKSNEFLTYVDPNPPISSPLVAISFQHTPKGTFLLSVKRLKYRFIRLTEAKVKIESRTRLILAPSGFVGYLIGPAKPPTKGFERLKGALLSSGLNFDVSGDWIRVELKQTPGDYMIWPAQLCFFRERYTTLDKKAGIECWNYMDGISGLSRDLELVEKKPEPLDEEQVESPYKEPATYPTPPHATSFRRTPKNIMQNTSQTSDSSWAEGRRSSAADAWQPDDLDAEFDIGQVQVTEADFDFFDEKPSVSPSNLLPTVPNKSNLDSQKTPDSQLRSPVNDQTAELRLSTIIDISSPRPASTNLQMNPLQSPRTFDPLHMSSCPSSPVLVYSQSSTPSSRISMPFVYKAKAIHPRVRHTNKKYLFGGRFWCPPPNISSSSSEYDEEEEMESFAEMRSLPHGEKRKREEDGSEERNERCVPFIESPSSQTPTVSTPFSVADDLLFNWNSVLLEDISLEDYLGESSILEGTEFDHVATILCEQVLYWEEMRFQGVFNEVKGGDAPEFNLVKKVLTSIFEESPETLKLGEFAEITDTMESAGSNSGRMLPKTTRTFKCEDLIFQIEVPDVFIARNDQYLALNPSALSLWHKNGFTPLAGPKNIVSFVLYPESEGLTYAVNAFLDELAEVYEQFGLGTHSRGVLKGYTNTRGMCPIPLNTKHMDLNSGLSSFRDACNKIGRLSGDFTEDYQNMVIYMVNPFRYPAALVSLCQYFLLLKKMYLSSLEESGLTIGSAVILQILPIDFMVDSAGVPFRAHWDLKKLAFEIYDKADSINKESDAEPILTHSNSRINSPAFTLKKPVPKTIPFKLSSHGPSSLLQESSTIHIGYATSADRRWMCVTWCDAYGEFAYRRAFCLARQSTRPREFGDICREVWECTVEILRTKKIKWKVVLSKVGVMGTTELPGWLQLIRSSGETNFSIVILNIDLQPSIQLEEILGFKSTPLSTDSNYEGIDCDLRISNADDLVWGVLTNHRMRVGRAGVDNDGGDNFLRFSLGTGFLVKRVKGERPNILQVNLLHSVDKPVQPKLKDILIQFRNMTTFGIVKGVLAKTECIPWHLSAANQMQKILSSLM
ncbi:Mediator of RNA polymerase II transcription subunit 13, partial [Neolecta irregularis DAH-3]